VSRFPGGPIVENDGGADSPDVRPTPRGGHVPNPEPISPSSVDLDPEPINVSWDELDRLVGVLADRVGSDYDLVLAITRGGLVPAGILAYRLDLREILVAGVEFYTTGGRTHEAPRFGHFPDAELLRGKRILVVDEVWESGETMAAVFERVRAAGGLPMSAVIHYKPGRSRVALEPDHYAALAHGWVTYPYKVGD
jgi:hypoxanthine phosphoribosyltransferase